MKLSCYPILFCSVLGIGTVITMLPKSAAARRDMPESAAPGQQPVKTTTLQPLPPVNGRGEPAEWFPDASESILVAQDGVKVYDLDYKSSRLVYPDADETKPPKMEGKKPTKPEPKAPPAPQALANPTCAGGSCSTGSWVIDSQSGATLVESGRKHRLRGHFFQRGGGGLRGRRCG